MVVGPARQLYISLRIDVLKSIPETEFFLTFKETKNRFQGTNFDRLCSLAGRYDNPLPIPFLAPIDYLKFQHWVP